MYVYGFTELVVLKGILLELWLTYICLKEHTR